MLKVTVAGLHVAVLEHFCHARSERHLRRQAENRDGDGNHGRSGQGALIFTYCSSYSPHDRHYFQQQSDLVAGAVQAPRLDLCNKELLLTHLNALAISEIGLPGLEEQGGAKPSVMRFQSFHPCSVKLNHEH